jgi:hypothetical protein
MARVALDTFLLGGHGELHAGDEVPESWNVGGGEEFPTDFARLEELGLVEPKGGRRRNRGSADPEPEPEPEVQPDPVSDDAD